MGRSMTRQTLVSACHRSRGPRCVVFALAFTCVSCGHRPPIAATDGAVDSDSRFVGQPDTQDAADVDDCILATRLEGCCRVFVAASVSEIQADPCLDRPDDITVEIPRDGCGEVDSCENLDCDHSPPPSRLIDKTDGGCVFVSECGSAEDCTLATGWTGGCCACPQAYPPSLLGDQQCLLPTGVRPPRDCVECRDILCERCLPVEARCEPHKTGSAIKQCVTLQFEF